MARTPSTAYSMDVGLCRRLCASYKWAQTCNLKATSFSAPQRPIPIDELPDVCQRKFNLCVDQVTNDIPNSAAQKHVQVRRGVSLLHSNIIFFPPPESSIIIDPRSKGSLMVRNHPRTQKRRIKRSRRTSFQLFCAGQQLGTTADLMRSYRRCRPGEINRRAP